MLLCYGFQESCCYQEWRCRALNFCHAGTKNMCPSLMSCQNICEAIQIKQSTVLKKGHHAGERTILFRVSIFAKGQINEECLLRNVESWQSLRLADTSDLVWGRLFGCWCCCVNASRNLVATRNHVAEHWTFAMLKEWTLALRPSFVQQSSSYRPPVLKKGLACRCQPVTLVSKPFSSEFPFSQRVRPMKSVSFAMLKAEKTWAWQTPQTLCWEEL